MRRSFALLGLAAAALAGAVSLAVIPSAPSQAASPSATFVVPANDGYGVGDCVASGAACARIVADAWCEAQGFARSATFGFTDDVEVTGSIPGAAASRSVSITCAQ